MANPVTPRHVRHRARSRLRRSRSFKAFLSGLQSVLNATGAAISSWTATAPQTLTAATATLTASTFANGDTCTIGSKTYTFQDTLTNVDGNVKRRATQDLTLTNLYNAINLGGGTPGTDYATAMTAHTQVTATSVDATHLIITAKTKGTAGNSIATTETGAGTAWGGSTMAGGLDAVAASSSLAKTAHGLHLGDGPFILSNSGGSLPTPLTNSKLYWVAGVPDANKFSLTTEPGGPPLILSAAGSGTNTMTKASSLDAVWSYLKKHGAPAMRAATDVDGL